METPTPKPPTGEISLAALLNVLWRRRSLLLLPPLAGWLVGLLYGIIVTPLYSATATVRPGITAFRPDGGGDREWRLKDIKRWYAGRLYRHGVAARMQIGPRDAPAIRAEFIERGLQNIQGGNVITLRCLDPDPQRAVQALNASIEAFADYVEADTLSSSIALTRRGLLIQIAERERRIDELQTSSDRVRLQLQQALIDSAHVEVGETLTQFKADKIERATARMLLQMQALQSLREDLQSRLSDLDKLIASSPAHVSGGSDSPSGVKPEALVVDTDVYRGLLDTAVRLRGRLYAAEIRSDSLQHRIDSSESDIATMRANAGRDLARDRAGVHREIEDLRISLSREIPEQRRAIQLEIRSRNVQQAALSPLERVGTVTATDGPVRPRKRRAILILMFAGLMGGVVLSYTWDYVARHRTEIFRS